MQNSSRLATLALMIICLSILGCSKTLADTIEIEPAVIEKIEGTEFTRIVLTAEAAKRLDIQTAEVREAGGTNGSGKVVPYSSLMYDEFGNNFTYVMVEPLTFRRTSVTVDYIEGDVVYLFDGPPSGTAVVTVGAAELWGVEIGVGK